MHAAEGIGKAEASLDAEQAEVQSLMYYFCALLRILQGR